jgi:hypothetical protein
MRHVVRVLAALLRLRPNLRIAEVGEIRVVELDVAAPGAVERRDLLPIDPREVFEELVEVGIRRDVDPLPTAPEMHHRRGRDGDLWRLRRDGLQELEVSRLNVLYVAKLACHGDAWGCEVDRAGLGPEFRGDAARDGNTGELLEKVHVKKRTPELAVGDALQPDGFLFLHHIANRFVFDGTQLFFGDFAALKTSARVFHSLWTEQTADLVGAERRIQPWHGGTSLGRLHLTFFR